jgi:hypothetical protein
VTKPTAELWGVTPSSLALPALADASACLHATATMGRLQQGTSAEQPRVNVSQGDDGKTGTWTCRACGQIGHTQAQNGNPNKA